MVLFLIKMVQTKVFAPRSLSTYNCMMLKTAILRWALTTKLLDIMFMTATHITWVLASLWW
jgi:hypothetical protein